MNNLSSSLLNQTRANVARVAHYFPKLRHSTSWVEALEKSESPEQNIEFYRKQWAKGRAYSRRRLLAV